jgi:stage II sporulation protein D
VDSPGGEDCSRYYGEVTISQSDFVKTMQSQWPEIDFSGQPTAWFRDSHRTEAGSIIDVLVGDVRLKGSEVRQALGLNSANFKVKVEGENLIFTTIGYGHGVGMSQYGARYFALNGDTYDQILSHYYPGTQLRLQG